MKISKISVILFIFLLAFSILPALTVTTTAASHQTTNYRQATTTSTDSIVSGSSFVNASLKQINRNVTVFTTGLVTVEDDFTLHVIGTNTEIATLNYSIPTEFISHVQQARFYTQFGDNVGIVSGNNSRPYTVMYGESVTTYQIDIRQGGQPANSSIKGVYFSSLLTAMDVATVSAAGNAQRTVLDLPVVPMFPNLPVKDATVNINLDGSLDKFVTSEITKIDNGFGTPMPTFTDKTNVLSYTNMSRDAFDYRYGMKDSDLQTFTFDSENPATLDSNTPKTTAFVPLSIENASRVVSFDPWGTVYVREQITIRDNGIPFNDTSGRYLDVHQVQVYPFTFSSKALLVDVYDSYGSLTHGTDNSPKNGYPDTTQSATAGKQVFQVKFRNPIFGGESYTFTADYRYNASEIVSKNSNLYTMNTTLFSDFNVTAKQMTVRYEFPVGTTFKSQTYSPSSRFVNYDLTSKIGRNPLSAFNHFELVYSLKNASFVDNDVFQITFTYNGLGHFQYAATYLYVTLLILAVAYGLSSITFRPSKAIEIEKAQLPIAEMDNFFNLFSEKTGAEKRISELRSRRVKGKLSKKDYDGQVKAIDKRIREINPQLEDAAKKLSAYGGRYENYVKKVMLSAQRQVDIRRNARQTKASYDKGNIPKDIYQLRIKEFNDNLQKEEANINKTLTEMVEIIQKFNQ